MPVKISAQYNVSPAFDVLVQQTKRVEAAVVGLGRAGPEQIRRLAVASKEVAAEYAKNSDGIVFANAEVDRSFKNVERTMEAGRRAYIEQAITQRQARREVNAMAGGFSSLEASLIGLPGQWGRVAAATGGAVLAFERGWAAGRKIDTWLEKNVSGWKTWRDNVAEDLALVLGLMDQLPDKIDKVDQAMFKGTRTAEIWGQVMAKMGKQEAYQKGLVAMSQFEMKEGGGIPTVPGANAYVEKLAQGIKLATDQAGSLGRAAFGDKFKSDLKQALDYLDQLGTRVAPGAAAAAGAVRALASEVGVLSTQQEKAKKAAEEHARELEKFDAAKARVDNLINTVDNAFAAPRETGLETKLEKIARDAVELKIKLQDAADALKDAAKAPGISPQLRQQDLTQARRLEDVIFAIPFKAAADQEATVNRAMEDVFKNVRPRLEKEQMQAEDAVEKFLNEMRSNFAQIPLTGEDAITRLYAEGDRVLAAIRSKLEAVKIKIEAEVRTTGEVKPETLNKGVEDVKVLLEGLRQWGKDTGVQAKKISDYELQKLKEGGQFLKSIFDTFREGLADVFLTGGKNLGQIASQFITKGVEGSLQQLFEGGPVANLFGMTGEAGGASGLLESWFGITRDAVGNYIVNGKNVGKDLMGAMGAAGGAGKVKTQGGILMGALAGVQGYEFGRTSTQSDLSTGISSAVAGLPLLSGGIYGVVAYVLMQIGTAVGKILQPSVGSQSKYAWGLGTNLEGRFGGLPNANIDKNTWLQMVAEGQAAFDSSFNGWQKILNKFPGAVVEVNRSFLAAYGRFEDGADFGQAASQGFMQEFENWIRQGFPREIAERFFPVLESAFVSVGFSKAKFGQIWADLQGLDPAKMRELVGMLAEGAISLQKSLAFFRLPVQGSMAGGAYQPGALDQVKAENARTFAQALGASDANIVQMAEDLGTFTTGSEASITAFKDLSTALEERMNQVRQYLQEVADAMVNVTKSISDRMDEVRLSMMEKATYDQATGTYTYKPDVQKQVDYLFNRLQQLGQSLEQATSPQAVQQLTSDAMASIQRIAELGISTARTPAERQAWQQWELDNLQRLQDASVGRLNKLASDLDAVNVKLLNAIGDLITAFETLTDALTPPDTSTPPGSEGPPGTTTPIVQLDPTTFEPVTTGLGDVRTSVEAGNATLKDILAAVKEKQTINVTTGDQNFTIIVGGAEGGSTGASVSSRAVRGRVA